MFKNTSPLAPKYRVAWSRVQEYPMWSHHMFKTKGWSCQVIKNTRWPRHVLKIPGGLVPCLKIPGGLVTSSQIPCDLITGSKIPCGLVTCSKTHCNIFLFQVLCSLQIWPEAPHSSYREQVWKPNTTNNK